MKTPAVHWFKYSSPQNFYFLAGRLWPWFTALATVLMLIGLWISFFVAPVDAQQGQGYRIIFVHVPASQMSMFIYIVMAAWAGIGLAFNTRLSGMLASALAPTGALFAFLSLITGALWGKPMWGTWCVWDARLTSELILLFLYLGFLALQSSIDDPRRADKAGAVLALVGVVNVPIIYFSVVWWNTLHQGASVSLNSAPCGGCSSWWPLFGCTPSLPCWHGCATSSSTVNAIPSGSKMQWNSVSEFFAMGGYALYVWGSFGATALVMLVESLLIQSRRKAVLHELRALRSEPSARSF